MKDKGFGIKPSDEKRDCMSNVRFTDHVLMMASSLTAQKMLEDYKKYGSTWS